MPRARARRAGPGHGRAGVGGDPAPPRGRRLRRRAGRAGHGLLRDEGGRAPLRRRRAGAEARARRGRRGLGRPRGCGRAALRRARRRERRAAGPGADRLRRPHALVPRAAAADAPAARARPLRGAGGTGSSHDRTACRATGCRRCRTIGAGRPARLEPGEGRAGREGGAETAGGQPCTRRSSSRKQSATS